MKNSFFASTSNANTASVRSDASNPKTKKALEQCIQKAKRWFPADFDESTHTKIIEKMVSALIQLLGNKKHFGIRARHDTPEYALNDISELIHLFLIPTFNRRIDQSYLTTYFIMNTLADAIIDRHHSVLIFFHQHGFNCFDFYRAAEHFEGFRWLHYNNAIREYMHSGALLGMAEDEERTSFVQSALDAAILITDTDCVKTLITANTSLISFRHLINATKTLGNGFAIIQDPQEYVREKTRIFNSLIDNYQSEPEELNKLLCYASNQLTISMPVIKTLLALDANPNYVFLNADKSGLGVAAFHNKNTSALLEACEHGLTDEYLNIGHSSDTKKHIQLVKLLLEKGAVPNLKLHDTDDHTVFHCVVKKMCGSTYSPLPKKFTSSILKSFIKAGADPFIQTANGENCFDLAKKSFQHNGEVFEKLWDRYNPENQRSCIVL